MLQGSLISVVNIFSQQISLVGVMPDENHFPAWKTSVEAFAWLSLLCVCVLFNANGIGKCENLSQITFTPVSCYSRKSATTARIWIECHQNRNPFAGLHQAKRGKNMWKCLHVKFNFQTNRATAAATRRRRNPLAQKWKDLEAGYSIDVDMRVPSRTEPNRTAFNDDKCDALTIGSCKFRHI